MTLVEKVLNFEGEVSGEDFVLEVKEDIEKLETLEDVRNYYLYDRGWIDDESLVDVLTYFLVNIWKEGEYI
jgi:hypothetical protein